MDVIQAGAMKFRIDCKLNAGVKFDDAAGVHVAWCPALDVYSQGESESEAKAAIESAVLMYVKNCVRRGVLESVLKARGFGVSDKPRKSDTGDSGEYVSVRPEAEEDISLGTFGSAFDIAVPLELLQQPRSGATAWQ